MNTILLFLIGIPALEIFVMIKIGQNIGAINTLLLIFLTAVIGIYFAKLQGLNTLRAGLYSMYKNEIPLFEMVSGASIAFAACLLILPGFITDTFGFFLLVPWTRKFIIGSLFKNKKFSKKNKNYIDGEIINKDKKGNGNEL